MGNAQSGTSVSAIPSTAVHMTAAHTPTYHVSAHLPQAVVGVFSRPQCQSTSMRTQRQTPEVLDTPLPLGICINAPAEIPARAAYLHSLPDTEQPSREMAVIAWSDPDCTGPPQLLPLQRCAPANATFASFQYGHFPELGFGWDFFLQMEEDHNRRVAGEEDRPEIR